MDPIECLCGEHDLIQRVLERFESLIEESRRSGRVRAERYAPFVEFLRGFTVATHFCKEEHGLFPLLHDRGVPRAGSPLAALAQEHRVLDGLVTELATLVSAAERGGPPAVADMVEHATRLIGMLRDHVERADHCMFGLAATLLDTGDAVEVGEAFAEAERRAGDPQTVQRWRELGHSLAQPPGA